jgi:hypothetical protein
MTHAALVPVRRIIVEFAGPGAGTGPLTWGQREILPVLLRDQSSFSVGGLMRLPGGRSPEDVAADLRYVLSRHPALRTRLRLPADAVPADAVPGDAVPADEVPDGAAPAGRAPRAGVSAAGVPEAGEPQQVIAAAGTAALDVFDAGDADPAQIAQAVHASYDERAFDFRQEWPVRWAVVTQRGVVTHLVSLISHLAVDGAAVLMILDDLAAWRGRDQAGPAGLTPPGPIPASPTPVGMAPLDLTPLELAERQAAPAALRQTRAAIRYWERLLRTIPPRRLTPTASQQSPRYRQVYYDSPASFLAAQVVAAQVGVDTAAVLLAAYAVVLGRLTGGPAVIQVVVDNRFRPALAGVIGPVTHPGLCVLDVEDVPFTEAVRLAWRSAIGAYKYAYCDPVRRAALIAEIGAERGAELDLTCYLNDRRLRSRQEPGARLPSPGEVEAALARAELSVRRQTDKPGERCFLHINNVPGTVHFELLADTRYLPPKRIGALLRGMEAVLVQAVIRPAAVRPAAVRPAAVPAR